MSFKKGHSGGPGRPPGHPNKATSKARDAIAQLVDDNAHKLIQWLTTIADGVPRDKNKLTAKQIRENDIWEKKPDPGRAFDMLQSLLEYHIPKLARTELTGKDGKPLMPPTEDDKKNLERFYREKFNKGKSDDGQSGTSGTASGGTEEDGE